MRKLGIPEIEDIARGAALLGAGGGGDPYLGKLVAIGAINECGPVTLLDPDEVPDDALIVPFAMMGAPTVLCEKIIGGSEYKALFDIVSSHEGRKVYATMPMEAGGLNSMFPIAAAARLGLPMVDCDGMGRAFPELQMVTFTIGGISASPMGLADEKGNTVIFDTITNKWSEELARAVTMSCGGSVAVTLYNLTGKQLKEYGVKGIVTRSEQLGAAMRTVKNVTDKTPEEAFLEFTEGFKLFKKAMDGGSHHAMLNMFTILWCDERYQEAIDLLVRIRKNPSPSLKCLWNYAFFLFMGEDYPHNPIKEKSPERAKMILNGILDEQGNPLYNDDKDIFMAIYDFMEYIDNGNILSSKASDFHWRIKTNSDSLVAKGHDVIFNELDALSLDEGLHMSLRFADPKKKGTGFHYYVFNQKNEEDKDILKFLHVKESSMGIWQIYLLMTSPMIAPIGCGVDDERTFILTGDELYDIGPLSCYNLSDLTRQEYLHPSALIEQEPDGLSGKVYCCYWSCKEGLVREEIRIHLHNGMVNSYELVGKFVIYKYDGIYRVTSDGEDRAFGCGKACKPEQNLCICRI